MNINEHELERLVRLLPPAPTAWVRAAQELPFVKDEVAEILERAAANPAFREELRRDADGALRREGHTLTPDVVAHILRKLPGARS